MATFPGKFGLFSLIVAPLVFVVAVASLLGIMSSDEAAQMRNIADAEVAAGVGFSLLVIAYILLPFALFTLAGQAYRAQPRLTAWGGSLAIGTVMVLMFYLGIEHVQRQAAPLPDHSAVVQALGNNAFTPALILLPLCMLGFPLLGYAAYRAQVLPGWRAAGLTLMLLMPVGVVGGVPFVALFGPLGVAAACIPLGLQLWRVRGTARDASVGAETGT